MCIYVSFKICFYVIVLNPTLGTVNKFLFLTQFIISLNTIDTIITEEFGRSLVRLNQLTTIRNGF